MLIMMGLRAKICSGALYTSDSRQFRWMIWIALLLDFILEDSFSLMERGCIILVGLKECLT